MHFWWPIAYVAMRIIYTHTNLPSSQRNLGIKQEQRHEPDFIHIKKRIRWEKQNLTLCNKKIFFAIKTVLCCKKHTPIIDRLKSATGKRTKTKTGLNSGGTQGYDFDDAITAICCYWQPIQETAAAKRREGTSPKLNLNKKQSWQRRVYQVERE